MQSRRACNTAFSGEHERTPPPSSPNKLPPLELGDTIAQILVAFLYGFLQRRRGARDLLEKIRRNEVPVGPK